VFTKRVHVFKAGSQTSAQGVQREFSPEDLDQVVESYDPSIHEAPLVIGHQGDNDSLPSYGWIKKFVRQGENLYADVAFTDTAKDLVKDGHYRKVSISFYSPDSPINPHGKKWSARHLALLGAAPPAVKGLEPFSFSEENGVLNFSASLSLEGLFDEELGPTMNVENSPLEMLKAKLDQVRQDLSSESQGKTNPEDNQNSPSPEGEETETEKQPEEKFSEIAQQTAELEDNLPEDQFMEDGKISRKRAKGAHGQDVQVVEELHNEAEEDAVEIAASHGEMPEALKKKANAKDMAMDDDEEDDDEDESSADHSENLEFDEVSYKTAKGGKVSFGKKKENSDSDRSGRMETARNDVDGYGNRMRTGKAGADGETGRLTDAESAEQDQDRLNTAKNGSQDADRVKLAKSSENSDDREERWAGQADGYDKVHNNDQYDLAKGDYPEPNQPGDASGSDPAGRSEGPTKVPTETEETPDDTVFATQVTNVMSDKDMRVLRQKSSDGRAPVKGGAINHAEKSEKKSKEKQLSGDFDKVDEAAQVTGPAGVFSEEHAEGKKKDPYTKTGFGSTYEEGEGIEESQDDDDYNETDDFCGMDNYGMGSMSQARPMGEAQMYMEEIKKLKAEHAELQRLYSEEKRMARKEKIASFVDSLYSEGRLTDGVIPEQELISYCEGLEFGTLEYSEGETPASKLMGILAKLPPMVTYGEVVQGGTFQFSEEDLDPHTKALRLVESEGIDYVEALKKTMYS
jgi:hypothetical protein